MGAGLHCAMRTEAPCYDLMGCLSQPHKRNSRVGAGRN